LSLAQDVGQFVVVLAPVDVPELVLNGEIAALGRYLGRVDIGTQTVPLVLARRVEPVVANESSPPAYLAEFQGAVRIPEGLYDDIDDERPLVETRPYYLTVGQVKTELDNPGLWSTALDANANANALHQQPDDFRGRPCTVRGIVYHVWKDEHIAVDTPFDVRVVNRVLLFKRDSGVITEHGATSTKQVLRLYELALVGDRPAPKPGDYIEADGRFLKWRAIPASAQPDLDRVREVKRQSANVYAMFFVAAQWRAVEEPKINWRPITNALGIGAGVFFILIVWWIRRESRVERRLHADLTALRQGRRALAKKGEPPAP
jgi:hypothetical protein